MRSKKPQDWPRYMSGRPLKGGVVGYYWAPPTKFKKRGCTITAESLGIDYAAAKARCDDVLNPMLDAWAKGQDDKPTGTLDWLVSEFEQSDAFITTRPKTQSDYRKGMKLVTGYHLKDGRRLGDMPLPSITPAVVDLVHTKLKPGRLSMANASMRAMRRAWNIVWRAHSQQVPTVNPFAKMGLKQPEGKGNVAASWEQLWAFIQAADAAGEPAMGTAALITWEWLQREEHILGTLAWSHYRPKERPEAVKIIHPKTNVEGWLPLDDEDGRPLYPELDARLSDTSQRGTLIIMRDKPVGAEKTFVPYKPDHFRHRAAEIRQVAGLPDEITFTTFRHGGFTELGDADVNDAGIRALGQHQTAGMQLVYVKRTERQRLQVAKQRRDHRTRTK